MRTKFCAYDVVDGLRLLGVEKTKAEVDDLNSKYKEMINIQAKFDSVNNAIKIKVGELEELFAELGITFSSDNIVATAFLQGKELCRCEEEWADIYNVAIATIDKIMKTLESENHTDESQKLKNKWQETFKSISSDGELEDKIEKLKELNNELNALWKKSIDFYSELKDAQNAFYSLSDSTLFEKYFGERLNQEEIVKEDSPISLNKQNKKMQDVKNLFKSFDILLADDNETHFAYIITDNGPVFLAECDKKFELLQEKVLRTIEGVQKAIQENDLFVIEHWKKHLDFFKKLDVQKLREAFEKLLDGYRELD